MALELYDSVLEGKKSFKLCNNHNEDLHPSYFLPSGDIYYDFAKHFDVFINTFLKKVLYLISKGKVEEVQKILDNYIKWETDYDELYSSFKSVTLVILNKLSSLCRMMRNSEEDIIKLLSFFNPSIRNIELCLSDDKEYDRIFGDIASDMLVRFFGLDKVNSDKRIITTSRLIPHNYFYNYCLMGFRIDHFGKVYYSSKMNDFESDNSNLYYRMDKDLDAQHEIDSIKRNIPMEKRKVFLRK